MSIKRYCHPKKDFGTANSWSLTIKFSECKTSQIVKITVLYSWIGEKLLNLMDRAGYQWTDPNYYFLEYFHFKCNFIIFKDFLLFYYYHKIILLLLNKIKNSACT